MAATAKRVSTGEAIRRLAEKDVPQPAYKRPRGNPETDPQAVEYERRRLELVTGR